MNGGAQRELKISMNSTPKLLPKPQRKICPIGENWPRANRQEADLSESNEQRLNRRLLLMESLVHDICCALVFCDDVALAEREMLAAGEIFFDLSSELKRQPLLLRRCVADISRKHGRPVSPPEHFWK